MNLENINLLNLLNREPFYKKNGVLFFLKDGAYNEFQTDSNKIKTFFKKFPGFYNFLQLLITPAFTCIGGLNAKDSIKKSFKNGNLKEKIILNIGSGTKKDVPEMINVDIYPFKNVDMIADIKDMPFKDGSVDMIVVDAVLEHIEKINESIKEISRVVKKGGFIYVSVPFVYPFHASPNDFYRWTIPGIEKSFNDFSVVKSGMRGGPAGSLQGTLMHFFATLFSLGFEKLYIFLSYFFMILFSPIKVLDFLFRFLPFSSDSASHIYYLGVKK